ncbi:MAG: VanW family protein [Christensenellales bacterium]|jgi:vancomycin resistance protein YoaR
MPKNYSKRSGSKRKKANGVRIFQWVTVVVLFAALIFVLSLLLKGPGAVNRQDPDNSPTQLDGGRFSENTTVNGVSIGGLSPEEARAALSESVNTQLDGVSVTLAYGSSVWTADASAVEFASDLESVLSTAMQAGPGEYHTSVTVDRASLASFIRSIATEIDREAVEPTLHYDPEAPTDAPPFTVIDGQSGLTVDVEATIDAVIEQLASGTYGKVSVVVNETPPTVSASELAAKVTLIASFTTEFKTKEAGRTHNLNLACEKLNGISIADGETFSFNDVVGPRDEANGWKEALVIIGGSRYEDGWGGGICQVSTTLYNALLLTGCDFADFSRVNHSIPSGYVDRGLDATVAYGSKDLKFTNTTGSTVYIVAYTSDLDQSTGKLTFNVYGQALPEGTEIKVYSKTAQTLEPPEPEYIYDPTEPPTYKKELQKERKGYVVEVYREKIVNGVSQGAELLYTDTYKPVQGIYTVGSATQSPGGDDVEIPEDDSFIP